MQFVLPGTFAVVAIVDCEKLQTAGSTSSCVSPGAVDPPLLGGLIPPPDVCADRYHGRPSRAAAHLGLHRSMQVLTGMVSAI
jgi:hypothetical protein